jgi:hypothetical protein
MSTSIARAGAARPLPGRTTVIHIGEIALRQMARPPRPSLRDGHTCHD